MCVFGSRPWSGLDVNDARWVAAELGKYLEGPVLPKAAENEPCLRIVLTESCHRLNPTKAAAAEKDNAVRSDPRIRRCESEFERYCDRETYWCERSNDQSASRCCCQPGRTFGVAQHRPESCTSTDQN